MPKVKVKMIKIENLSKRFKDVLAVDNVSFKVKKGELFAFLGLNGAGKSTTINMICGNLKKDSGSIHINGVSIDEDDVSCKQLLGVVYQTSVLDKALSVKDNLQSRASLYSIHNEEFEARLKALSKLLDLDAILNRTFSKLSGGQKRRVDIARALIHRPQVLILDEPTTGLDPQTRQMVWGVVNKLRNEEGITVFLTTHYMEEASDADYVVILDSGKICAEGTPIQLKNEYTGDYVYLYNQTAEVVKSLGVNYQLEGNKYKLKIKNTTEATNLILAHPKVFVDYEVIKGDMDSVFLNATGKKLTISGVKK